MTACSFLIFRICSNIEENKNMVTAMEGVYTKSTK